MEESRRAAKRNTKEDILNTSIELFSENGFSAVSVRDITKKVGINESSLYNHFKSKDEILDVIIEKFSHDFGSAFLIDTGMMESSLAEAGPQTFLHRHIMNLRDRMTPDIQRIWKIIYMEMFRNKRIRGFFLNQALKASSKYYRELFGMMAEKGLIKPADPAVLADELNFALVGLQMESMLLQTDNGDISANGMRIAAHIRFICDAVIK